MRLAGVAGDDGTGCVLPPTAISRRQFVHAARSPVAGRPNCAWPSVALESMDYGYLFGKYPDLTTTLTIPSDELAADVKSVNRLIAADPLSVQARHLPDVRDWIADARRLRS